MTAERSGYTVTMFVVDVTPTMGEIYVGAEPNEPQMTKLQWVMRFVKHKIQEMIFHGRKTDQCGVVLFGTDDTDNRVNRKDGGYTNVTEYIPIGHPNAKTLEKLDAVEVSSSHGDALDGLIVATLNQEQYMSSKKTWTKKAFLLTDGESVLETDDWENTVQKMNDLRVFFTVVGVDFDDPEMGFKEEDKSRVKEVNEQFYAHMVSEMTSGEVHNLSWALEEISRPDVGAKPRSALLATVLRLGDVNARSEEAIELPVRTSKCTAIKRPKAFKKFALRPRRDEDMEILDEDIVQYVQLKPRTEYYIDTGKDQDGDSAMGEREDEESSDGEQDISKKPSAQRVDDAELVRGYKYGATYVPAPEGGFPALPTQKGIDICGFFPSKHFHREFEMGETSYVWGNKDSPQHQVALSSFVQAMDEKGLIAIARWVSRDGGAPKMGVLKPKRFARVDCLLWCQMPFADDVRKYTFTPLVVLESKKGEEITEHPYIPTHAQQEAMDNFVDAMDLNEAGPKDENGNRTPWFDPLQSYNPSFHRVQQAIFHCAVVPDVATHPLPPPHPELTKYFEPPKRVLKKASSAVEELIQAMAVKPVPKKVGHARKDDHAHVEDEEDLLALLGDSASQPNVLESSSQHAKGKLPVKKDDSETEDDSATEDEDDEPMESSPLKKPVTPVKHTSPSKRSAGPLPTPARSVSPDVDPGRRPGALIGTTFPLKDFNKNLQRGDLVTQCVQELSNVIKDVISRPFWKRRKDEMLECLTVLRKTCLEEDEIEFWNKFMPEFKELCDTTNPQFWEAVTQLGRDISLISVQEAKRLGGDSKVSENAATEFLSS